eukprot:Ihof_evm21s40 gene=Ihof_evmTU21s40
MGKAEAGTPKALANKMKSKGLQKLRWFCQMCQKQCRDENGFKCHTMSEGHQRQMGLFADNPTQYLDSFSQEFQNTFMTLLKRRFGTRRVHSNIVYNEYIGDKMHLHMNATMWETLTDFIKHLGKEGLVTVDETPKGWFMTYIDRDPRTLARQEAVAKKERMQLTDEERTNKMIEEQIQRAKATEGEDVVQEPTYTGLTRTEDSEKISLSLGSIAVGPNQKAGPVKNVLAASSNNSVAKPIGVSKRPLKESEKPQSAMEKIMEQEKLRNKKVKMSEAADSTTPHKKDNWILPHLVVKVISKKLAGGRYYKAKGVILSVQDKYVAEVELLQSGDVLKLDQLDLE